MESYSSGTLMQNHARGDAIVVTDLSKRYGQINVLNDISLEVGRGEFIALLGPSGCGKTTLLRSLAGFVTPDSGEIRIGGCLMTRVPPNRRPVNMVFQSYALFPHLTVAENVSYGPKRMGLNEDEIKVRVREALASTNLENLGDRYPGQISGGQQQRVALARSLVNRPQVLLLDEPLGALDLKLRKRMQIELKALHRALGLTIVFVTHDQEEALTLSDRVAVMKDGKIVQIGDPQTVYENPATCYVADFIGEANLLISKDLLCGGDSELVKTDSATTFMIRPENVSLLPGHSQLTSGFVGLHCTVSENIYTGPTWRVLLSSATGQRLAAALAANIFSSAFAVGSAVTAVWRANLMRCLYH
jgi:spermidine/putrescine transport system ATP-binding protein